MVVETRDCVVNKVKWTKRNFFADDILNVGHMITDLSLEMKKQFWEKETVLVTSNVSFFPYNVFQEAFSIGLLNLRINSLWVNPSQTALRFI